MSLLPVAAFPTYFEVTGTTCPHCHHVANQKADLRRHVQKGCPCAQPFWYQGKGPKILWHAEPPSGANLCAGFAG